ncbi:MAG TPA: Gfo/Idh/MocA family oxidoreductase, partial [Actinopolymorphaceae bacterium]
MTSEPVRIAIVGLDHWYTAIPLAQAITLHPETQLVGIYDADAARARQVATKVGCKRVAASPTELIEDDGVQVVAAFASVDRNPDTCVAAAEAGKHIVSVKPLARTLDEATTILTAVRKAGVRFLPGESRSRSTAHHRQLRTWAREGRFGRPLTATFQMWGGLPKGWPGATSSGWFTDADRAPGGGWIDHAIYHIDLLRWVFDTNVVKVSGKTANLKHAELPFEDY